MNKRRRWWTLGLAVVGLLLVAGSFVWSSVAVPKLVKYPTDVDETPVYKGTVTLYVDPATTAPLDPPKEFPLEVSRNIKVVASSSSLVVVKETASLKATGLFDSVQEQQYVMNRRSMQNVKDDRAWAFNTQNVVDRSPDYRINFPLDNKPVTTPIYSNEQAATYDANPDPANPSGTIEGLSVHNFVADYGFKPASEAYLAALDTSLSAPLPRELTLDKLSPLLAKAGIDISKLLPALLPALSEADRNTIVALAQQPVKLVYQFKGSGGDSVETSTGGIVEVRDVTQTLAASPDPSLAPTLTALLGRYTQVAGVPEAIANFQKLAAQPITIFVNTFSQTPESVKDIAGSVRDNVDSKELAETTVPLVMVIVGGVLAVLGFGLFFLWRKRPATASTAGPASPPSGDLGTDPGSAPLVPGDVPGGSMGGPHDPDLHGGSTS